MQESYHNLSKLWDFLNPYDFLNEHLLVTFAFDMKAAAPFFGIGSIASTYPCLYCTQPKSEFNNDKKLEGGPLRSIGEIKKNALAYKEACKSHGKKTKLSSAEFFSCEEIPIPAKFLPDNCLVLHVLPPMPLHTKLGIVNLLFDVLDDYLEVIGAPIRAIDWAHKCGLIQTMHYGGKVQFNGRGCQTLLNSLDKLYSILLEHDLNMICKPFLDVFETFKAVVQSCFGNILFENRYKDDIMRFAVSFFKLIDFFETENQSRNIVEKLKLNVRPKVHVVFVHIVQFFEHQKSRGFANFGLGFYSEQSWWAFTNHVATKVEGGLSRPKSGQRG